MEKYNKILGRITWLYAILMLTFITYLVMSVSPDFTNAFSEGFKEGSKVAKDGYTPSILPTILAFPTLGVFGWFMVLLVKLIIRSTKAVIRKDIFNQKLIKTLNRFSLLYIITFVLMFVFNLTLSYAEDLPFKLQDAFTMVLSVSINAMVLLIMVQVLKIGQTLKEEQDLTI